MSKEGFIGAYDTTGATRLYDVTLDYYGSLLENVDWKMSFQILLYDTFKGYTYSTNPSAITADDKVTVKFVLGLAGQRLSREQMSARLSTRLARYPVKGMTIKEVSEIRFEPYRKKYIAE